MDIFSTGTNILLIVIGFGFLITVHEFGHFIAARWAGIRIEAFAIGMGPPIFTYRRGIGFRFGSSDRIVRERTGKMPFQLSHQEQQQYGLGETEYSLRILPLGGYVKMLGQEDANPGAVSEDPRSYTSKPVSKRMVVVSAGVIMNLITAIILFVAAFLVGVRFEAPVIGIVLSDSPAATARSNDENITGLKPDDEVLAINGSKVSTFSDIMIASALSVPDKPLTVEVQRAGHEDPLTFDIEPEEDDDSGLRQMGIAPASTTVLLSQSDADLFIAEALTRAGADSENANTLSGWRIDSVNGTPVSTWNQFDDIVDSASGKSFSVKWSPPSGSSAVDRTITLSPEPKLEDLYYSFEGGNAFTRGLLGLVPLVRIAQVPPDSPNSDSLHSGDVILSINGIEGPRQTEIRAMVSGNPGKQVKLLLLRDDAQVIVNATVNRQGMIGVLLDPATDLPRIAKPLDRAAQESGGEEITTPIAPLQLLPRSRIDSIASKPVTSWKTLRQHLLQATKGALDTGNDATVNITWSSPLADSQSESGSIVIPIDTVKKLHALGYEAPLSALLFEPLMTTLTANGNPLKAISMGFDQTWKMVVLTYLTIDRLFRGSVGVEQLHGPVGIVHIGTRVADRGFMYLIFFLAMISVNLAVLNFLPLPIVDGGLFLFLIYEKFRGRPPSIAFQNGAALLGIMLIGALFLMTFYFDIMRLAS